MAGDINFKLRYIVPLHPGIPRAHTVRKLGPEIPSELALKEGGEGGRIRHSCGDLLCYKIPITSPQELHYYG